MNEYAPGSQAATDQAFDELEVFLTTKVLPQYAKQISEFLATKQGRSLMLACAAQGYDTDKLKRVVENVLILQGRIDWKANV